MYHNKDGQPYGLVSNIQKYTIHDGPGIRTEIFFKGCNLNCLWCSNPEAINPRPQIGVYPKRCVGCGTCIDVCPEKDQHHIVFGAQGLEVVHMGDICATCMKCVEECPGRAIMVWGEKMTIPELMDIIEKDRQFYDTSGGGVTLSGGEVLVQAEFVKLLLKACKDAGIHTCVESALNFPAEVVDSILDNTDLLISDLKHMDPKKHKEGTGATNELILENLKRLSKMDTPIVLRTPIIPDFNDNVEDISHMGAFVRDEMGGNIVQYQLLPYRKMGTEKHATLGQHYPLGDDYTPPEREVWEPNLLHLVSVLVDEYGLPAKAGSGEKLDL